MNKVAVFTGGKNKRGRPYVDYRNFIEQNQDILITFVNILEHDWIMLTYKELN